MSTVMYTSASTIAPIVAARDGCRECTETLMKLLANAKAAIDSDVIAARTCIEKAAQLLRPGPSDDRIRSVPAPTPRGGLAPWQAKRIASYIEANLTSSIRIEELAKVVQLSTSHFFRAFKQSFGVTPLTYIAHQRVRRAQRLMMSSPEPLAQIALDCGMCDQAHFTRVFRRVVGSCPRAWRRQFVGGALSPARQPGCVKER